MTILHSEKGESVDLAGKGDFVFILADFYFYGNSSTVNKFKSSYTGQTPGQVLILGFGGRTKPNLFFGKFMP